MREYTRIGPDQIEEHEALGWEPAAGEKYAGGTEVSLLMFRDLPDFDNGDLGEADPWRDYGEPVA